MIFFASIDIHYVSNESLGNGKLKSRVDEFLSYVEELNYNTSDYQIAQQNFIALKYEFRILAKLLFIHFCFIHFIRTLLQTEKKINWKI